MTPRKHRLTVTVDPEHVEAANRAVADGHADSVSSWVSTALSEKMRRDQQLADLRAAVSDFEDEFGEITPDEMAARHRSDAEDARVIRGRRTRPAASGRKSRSA